jgi:predicted nucleic acid-binding protein
VSFVVDASVALAWHFEDEASVVCDGLLVRTNEEAIAVPRHWHAEVANGILVAERRGRTSLARSADFTAWLESRDVIVDDVGSSEIFRAVLPLARAHRLTIYDALYLELAERRGLALATLDAQLADAARSVGVEVLGQEA